MLEPTLDGKTKLTLVHSRVPAALLDRYDEGWQQLYWKPLVAYCAAAQPQSPPVAQ